MKKEILYTLSAALLLGGCTKKLDYTYDNRTVQLPNTPSNSRIVNLAGATELKINGQALTSFLLPSIEGFYGADNTKGTRWFPESGRLGTTYTIPKEVFNNGLADSVLFSTLNPKNAAPNARPFSIREDEAKTFDYYFVWFLPNANGKMDSLFRIPRDISASVNPAAFKLRLLNLSSVEGANSLPGIYRKGPMTVTFADGTTVPGLSNVQPGTYSEYIDIPYGTYQFKVLDSDGKEVLATGGGYNTLNPNTGTLLDINGTPGMGGYKDTWLTYAPVKTFQPGGVYTIAVSSNYDTRVSNGNPNGETVPADNNVFRIINDVTEPLNYTYARMQGVNAMTGQPITWMVDGKVLSDALPFGKAGDYNIFITGKHTLQAISSDKKILADTTFFLDAADNISAWLYANSAGQPGVTLVSNNLSAKYTSGKAADDGTYNTLKDAYPFWIRFMNFCPDMKEVSFMGNNGQGFISPVQANATGNLHVPFAQPVVTEPYARMIVNFTSNIQVHASQPTVLPGDWMRNVSSLNSQQFIAHPELYKHTSLPGSEPGVYTVALIGRNTSDAGTADKARMIIVKHTK
ncbi:DUF4397 domain-containing protein [Chitinophaga sp. Cy-1792]|uniref:DUF4397 domain-containing protein n=1 Tax=Chitinophaga sp. Cy-1792 TaxID=2608339 RepID=UPI0014246C11|nr:DUF4397 domain-containing protein [Chitinophaga sp. Cy-1792]NIG56736.1 DUF4397 domain-containing protein [Chitinophaga sp. Cy-1792]